MAGVMHIPWYATVFRGDDFAAAVARRGTDRDALRGDAVSGASFQR